MTNPCEVIANNKKALFSLKLYRGDGMTLLAMNWKQGKPPRDFVGFAIEYKEPGGAKYYALKNRLSFEENAISTNQFSTLESPIQMFRWIHFPRNANLKGDFTYRVTPVFMNQDESLSLGEAQIAQIVLSRETYPGKLNVTFTRGFVSSQAFVDRYEDAGSISKLIPSSSEKGLSFTPTHPKAKDALEWMGFEAREAILGLLDKAISDKKAQVRVIAYELNEPEIVKRLEKLSSRLKIIIDDSDKHGKSHSPESQAARRLIKSAGTQNVKRQAMGRLQHNKTIVVDGPKIKSAVCGSTNFTWRGLYVQSNNALVVKGKKSIQPFIEAFENYWRFDTPAMFATTPSATFASLGFSDIDAQVSFSPHASNNALLNVIAKDIKRTTTSLFFSLAFLYQTPGVIKEAIAEVTKKPTRFVYGISDKKVGELDLQKPNGNRAVVYPSQLTSKNLPEPFKSEPSGGGGNRMHHKFVVVDFNQPTARVYLGSYNFSMAADRDNGENLLLIRDRRIATSYAIEALRLFDHYHFRVKASQAKKTKKKLTLKKAPKNASEKPWWEAYYSEAAKIRDRELFS